MAQPQYDDNNWRQLSVPHDWAIEGMFRLEHPSGAGGGALPGGMGWYRKHFDYQPQQEGERVFVEFDGVYMNSTVYINGHKLGMRPYGYSSFEYELTEWLHPGKDNVLAVSVDNSRQTIRTAGAPHHLRLTDEAGSHVGTHFVTVEVVVQGNGTLTAKGYEVSSGSIQLTAHAVN